MLSAMKDNDCQEVRRRFFDSDMDLDACPDDVFEHVEHCRTGAQSERRNTNNPGNSGSAVHRQGAR